MSSSQLLDKLIAALQVMPGIGPRSAARIAYTLLDRKRREGLILADVMAQALNKITLCPLCRNYSDGGVCSICSSVRRRDSGLLCVVESPSDVQAVESSGTFFGTYFVLHGHLSPIDGIGAQELGLDLLQQRFASGEVKELILATNPTVEGDATASYIAAMARNFDIVLTKIAAGVPVGGDLNTVDEYTLAASITQRRPFE
ncbi:MAG: recombination protein RecR [Proteobacteria bacterium]|uniref:Recombination protein RecR n=1 Tax=Candidatus Avisuccinivibrio stercorigallinarum TaxID=2840704 RepID=A0A9D9GU28_9GAMM|nr:recombination protein RecR [Candidatus Avisuccinivibrio stercorigallinarum]